MKIILTFVKVKLRHKNRLISVQEPGLTSRFVFALTGGFASLQLRCHVPQGLAHVSRLQWAAATLKRTAN